MDELREHGVIETCCRQQTSGAQNAIPISNFFTVLLLDVRSDK